MAVKEIVVGRRFLALSTDQKPGDGISEGAALKETDTGHDFVFHDTAWVMLKQKTLVKQWTGEVIAAQSFFSESIECADYDVATAFIVASASAQVSFRVTAPDGSDYAWDPLGTINSASLKASAQAQVTGMPFVKIVVTNGGELPITVDIYAYLGKRGVV